MECSAQTARRIERVARARDVDGRDALAYAHRMRTVLVKSGIAALVAALALACSGTSTSSGDAGASSSGASGSSGTSGGTPAVARVTLKATLLKGASSAAECPDDGKSLTIGTFKPPAPVADGASAGTGQVSIGCKVAASGAGFDANANVQLTGSSAAALLLNGTPSTAGLTKTGSVSLTIEGQTYSATTCVLDVDATAGQGIAAGRYWAGFTCARATQQAGPRVCDIQGELRIENCAQE